MGLHVGGSLRARNPLFHRRLASVSAFVIACAASTTICSTISVSAAPSPMDDSQFGSAAADFTVPDFKTLGFPSGASVTLSDGTSTVYEPPIIPSWSSAIKALAPSPIPDIPLAKDYTPWKWNPNTDITNCPSKTWAVTYDDGPKGLTQEFLDLLKSNKSIATFFVLGCNTVANPDWAKGLRAAYDAGHQIALHTWSHKHMTTQSTDQIINEFIWNALAVRQVIGKVPRYIRPPYGDVDDRVRAILAAFGFKLVIWNVVTQDTSIPVGSGDIIFPTTMSILQPTPTSTDSASSTDGTATSSSSPAPPPKPWLVYNSTQVINNTLNYGQSATGLDFLPNTGGYISLEHELTQEMFYAARIILPLIVSRGYTTASVAQCAAGTDTDDERYMKADEPFVKFLDTVKFPIDVKALQGQVSSTTSTPAPTGSKSSGNVTSTTSGAAAGLRLSWGPGGSALVAVVAMLFGLLLME
ncbi:hypothetical protein DFJ73DRAFT_868917 [Zopfochytrium polystomum]|nr:hypothetical protein DFJ73DRAFT_868917 [Zopfochytrium polystomum]